jgi:hypothetical protein
VDSISKTQGYPDCNRMPSILGSVACTGLPKILAYEFNLGTCVFVCIYVCVCVCGVSVCGVVCVCVCEDVCV